MHRMHHRMSMTPILRKSLAAVLCLVLLPAAQGETGPPPQGRAFHFAGGRMKSKVKLGENYSVALWLWNALPADARAVTGYAFSRGADGDKDHGEHFGIGGTYKAEAQGRLILFNGNEKDQLLIGKTKLAGKAWHHVVLVREGAKVRVHLDGKPVPDLEGELPVVIKGDDVFVGGRADNFSNWEGKLDEVAIFDRALTPQEANALYQAAKMTPPATSGSGFQPAGEDKDSGLEARATGVEFPPLSPEEGLKSIHVPDGFKVELVACEPDVIDPIAIDWDLAGRLWVVEMADYPSGMDGNGKPGGRVRVLEDTDGDGRYEKSTLFADGLNFPTGLLTWRDGVIVTAAPDVLFLKDTNGDGKADSTDKLLSGLSEGNQQLRANGLRWGLDGRVYCAAGGHHGGHASDTVLRSHRALRGYDDKNPGKAIYGVDTKIGSRDFSFDPDTGNVRAESGPSQFGRNRDDAGHWFGTQNSRALWHYVLPDHYLQRNPHVPAPDPTHLIVTPLNAPVYPVSPPEKRFHSFENAGHYTSACSGMIYRDELLWPRRDNELDAFTCEPFHNLVQHNILVEDGVTWKANRAPGEEKHDFFASTDRWCRPVMTRTGPDGALWVVDMYRYMIEHPQWLPENGRAELLPHYRLGDDKGRIYRVFRANKPPRKVKPLDKLKPVELVKALDSPSEWQRDKAHMAFSWWWLGPGRALSKEVSAEVGAAEKAALTHRSPLVRLHTLCVLRPNKLPPGVRESLLRDSDVGVRVNSLRQMDEHFFLRYIIGNQFHDTLKAMITLVEDPHPKVRLQLALTLGQWTDGTHPDSRALGNALVRLAIRDHADPWMRAAVMSSAVPHLRALCEGIAAAGGDAFAAYADGLLATALGLNDRDSLAAMLRPLLTGEEKLHAVRLRALARFLTALHGRGKTRPALMDKADALTEALRGISKLQDRAQDSLRNPEVVADLRSASAEFLSVEESTRPTVKEIVPNWLSPGSDAALQLAAVKVLASTGEATVPAILLHDFPSLTPQTRGAVIEALLTREPWAVALLEHVKANPATALDATQRARLAQHSSKKVSELAGAVLKAESSRKEVLEQFRPALSLKGDAARGKTVALRCIGCHQVDGAGLAIGPDLKSVASHPAEKLLTNIIDPSLDVQPGFFAFNAKLKDGSELYGLITSETGNSVSFKLTDGSTKLVLRSDLADLKSTGQSLMPPGLETGMTAQEMADLIAWLQAAR
jgi:putative membrane-bound dehydrogenase-like protein